MPVVSVNYFDPVMVTPGAFWAYFPRVPDYSEHGRIYMFDAAAQDVPLSTDISTYDQYSLETESFDVVNNVEELLNYGSYSTREPQLDVESFIIIDAKGASLVSQGSVPDLDISIDTHSMNYVSVDYVFGATNIEQYVTPIEYSLIDEVHLSRPNPYVSKQINSYNCSNDYITDIGESIALIDEVVYLTERKFIDSSWFDIVDSYKYVLLYTDGPLVIDNQMDTTKYIQDFELSGFDSDNDVVVEHNPELSEAYIPFLAI